MAVTADGMQGLARIGYFFGPYAVQVLEFSPDSKSCTPAGTLLNSNEYLYAIAIAPDNSRVFVARNRITALYASYS